MSASAPARASAAISQISATGTPPAYRVAGPANGQNTLRASCGALSVSLSVWANAWLAGVAAPDDVLDALSQWAPIHSVTAYDAVAAGRTGLPWPDVNHSGTMSLLQTLRTAAGVQSGAPAISVALPVPGDVRGLPAGTQFQRDAVTAGEAILVGGDPSSPGVGLVPDFDTTTRTRSTTQTRRSCPD